MTKAAHGSSARRSKQSYAIRVKLHCAFSQIVTNTAVLNMLVERGFLPDRLDNTEAEIEVALTRFVFAEAGDKNFGRVAIVMADRWHSARNLESRR